MKSPTLPAPAIATRISGSSGLRARAARAARRARTRRRRSGGRRPPGRSRSACTTCAAPSRVTAMSQNRPGSFERAELLARPRGGDRVARRGTPCRSGRPSRAAARPSGAAGAAPGRWSRRPSRRSGCRAAGRSARGAGRRCGRRRARCRSSPGRCGRMRMLELSPLVTAANAPASLDAGLGEVVAVEAEADDLLAA